MQTHAISTSRVCNPQAMETGHATGLQHFPESLGTADQARTSPTGHNLQSPMGPLTALAELAQPPGRGGHRWAAAMAWGSTTQH